MSVRAVYSGLAFAVLAAVLPAQQFRADATLLLAPGEQILLFDDLDGDGDSDLVIRTAPPLQVQVLTNIGDARFVRQPANAVSEFGGNWQMGDIDGDGDRDYLGANGSNRGFVLLRNDGTALTDVSATQVVLAQLHMAATQVFVDFDGDGDLDIVALQFGIATQLFLNSGSGMFTEVQPSGLSVFQRSLTSVWAHDLDGDGATDLILLGRLMPALWMHRGSTYADETATRLPLPLGYSNGLALFDCDGDGDLDIALATELGGQASSARLMENTGNGVFVDATATRLPAQMTDSQSVLAKDFDGDGDVDLIYGLDTGHAALLRNQGQGTFVGDASPWQGELPAFEQLRSALDLEGDRFPDLLTWPHLVVLRNLGGASLQVMNKSLGVAASLVFDVDGDGDPDFLANNTLWRNEGGRLHAEVGALSVGQAVAGDLDGDGDVDLVARGTTDIQVFFNDGTGNFTIGQILTRSGVLSSLALGDVDGDGDLDLATGEGLGGTTLAAQSQLWLNDGTGHFVNVTATNLPLWVGGLTSVQLADADADGDLDLLCLDFGTPMAAAPVRYYTNQGNGVFTDASNLVHAVVSQSSASRLQFEQLDTDPELELVLLLGSGLRICDPVGGIWQDETASRVPASIPADVRELQILDFDEDGDLDLLAANSNGRFVLANDGSGHFVDVTATRGAGLDHLGLPVDFDGDGDLDLLSNAGILLNMQRQLLLSLPPRTGHTSTLAFVAEPGFGTSTHLAMIGASLQRQPHPATSPFGTFFLGSSVLLAAMVSNQGASAIAPFSVPNNPALRGLQLYLQGIEVALPSGNFHFTNLLVTAIE